MLSIIMLTFKIILLTVEGYEQGQTCSLATLVFGLNTRLCKVPHGNNMRKHNILIMKHDMKLLERIIKNHFQKRFKTSEKQGGFALQLKYLVYVRQLLKRLSQKVK